MTKHKETVVYGRNKNAFVTEMSINGEHAYYVLYREEEESSVVIDIGKDLKELIAKAKKEQAKIELSQSIYRRKGRLGLRGRNDIHHDSIFGSRWQK